MPNERAILCGDVKAGSSKLWNDDPVLLRLWGADPEVTLCIEDISEPLSANIPRRFVDLIEIATYIYCADQAISRGGAGVDNLGEDWRRRLHFRIPVRDLEFWKSAPVVDALTETLSFLSEDEYHFDFQLLKKPPPVQTHFQFNKAPQGQDPEEVVLFSGGLDSLGGAVQEAIVDKRRVALVMHRSTEKLRKRHDKLCELVNHHAQAFRPRYFPVVINKKKSLGREYTQRSRSFLYASLGATIAELHRLSRIRFYENGVVSLNLPLSPQVVGAKATRTTHPRVINGFGRILSLVADRPFKVENPFIWKTKAEIIGLIGDRGCGDTIGFSTSCTHTWEMTKLHTHCGTCSQCIDRRFAILAAGQEAHDPAEAYKVDLLVDPRSEGEHRTMLAAYVETSSNITKMAPFDFYGRYGEVARVVRHMCGGADATAGRVFDLYQRHAKGVCKVVDDAIARYSSQIRNRELPDSCLLRLVCDTAGLNGDPVVRDTDRRPLPPVAPPPGMPDFVFRKKGQAWWVRFAGKEDYILLPSRGAAYLYLLLSRPNEAHSVVKLVLQVAKAPANFILGDAGERIDAEARTAYRARYAELMEEGRKAEQNNDEAAVERCRNEMDALAHEIEHRGFTIKPKKEKDDRERLRKSFQMAVRRAIKDIAKFDPQMAAHFQNAVRCGLIPVYDPRDKVEWDL